MSWKTSWKKNSFNGRGITGKKVIFSLVAIVLISFLLLIIGEFAVGILKPQPSLYPRWQYSQGYGHVLYKNVIMVHELPRRWKYTYGINAYGYRGEPIPVSNSYEKNNIVILGDSASFGTGVNDGEEYASVMKHHLGDNYDIINLSVGGYGLAQEIRRYYEFGQLYQPKIVILQFFRNDPGDNLYDKVTEIEEGRFIFKDTTNPTGWTKQYLSKSIIQRSQIYNSFRHTVYLFFKKRHLKKVYTNLTPKNSEEKISPHEEFYNVLLELFARDLWEKGIDVIMISVNGHLDRFPFINQKVSELERDGYLKYVEIVPWFENVENYGSPEGHPWGEKGHRILGEKLAEYVGRL